MSSSDAKELPSAPIDHQAFIAQVRRGLESNEAIRALFLGGSFGRGTADAFSDIDFVAVADPKDHDAIVRAWRDLLESIAPVVFWSERRFGSILLNAITEDWLRCDLFLVAPASLKGRAQDSVKPLVDRDGIYVSLPETLAPKQPDPNRVSGLIHEFIRVLGLLPVAMGRGEYYTSAGLGVGLQRDALMNLMLEEVTLPDIGGALHLSRVLPPEDMEVLQALPFPSPTRAELIDANLALARQFFPRARALASRIGLAWPERFEAATRRVLERQLGHEADISW